MDFEGLTQARYSCRKYDPNRAVKTEKIDRILEAARLSPSACNGQPYHLTVCQGESARAIAKATQSMGMNPFATNAPVLIVISEEPYCKTALFGSKIKKNDYRSLDIGIVAATITYAAADEGLGTCIIGWFDNERVKELCSLTGEVRLIITLGYALDSAREKKRKTKEELISFK